MALPEKPITRKETYLAKAAGQSVDLPEYPITREEAYLDEIARNGGGGGGYILPTATASRLGGVKIGSGISVEADGTISASGGGGGTTDYDDLDNKPQINGETLVGNKTPVQLGFGTVDNLVVLNAMTVAEFETWLAGELADVHDFTQVFQISFHAAVGDRISAGDVIRGSFISDGGFKFSGYLNGENTIATVTFDYSVQDGVEDFTVGDALALSSDIPTTASGISYDNTDSGLSATDVQGAVDELAESYPADKVMMSDGVTSVEDAVDDKVTVNGTTCNMAIIPRISVTFSSGTGSIDLSSHMPTGYRGSIGYAQANDTGSVAITGCAPVANTTGTYTVKAIAGGSAFTGSAEINFIIALLPTA